MKYLFLLLFVYFVLFSTYSYSSVSSSSSNASTVYTSTDSRTYFYGDDQVTVNYSGQSFSDTDSIVRYQDNYTTVGSCYKSSASTSVLISNVYYSSDENFLYVYGDKYGDDVCGSLDDSSPWITGSIVGYASFDVSSTCDVGYIEQDGACVDYCSSTSVVDERSTLETSCSDQGGSFSYSCDSNTQVVTHSCPISDDSTSDDTSSGDSSSTSSGDSSSSSSDYSSVLSSIDSNVSTLANNISEMNSNILSLDADILSSNAGVLDALDVLTTNLDSGFSTLGASLTSGLETVETGISVANADSNANFQALGSDIADLNSDLNSGFSDVGDKLDSISDSLSALTGDQSTPEHSTGDFTSVSDVNTSFMSRVEKSSMVSSFSNFSSFIEISDSTCPEFSIDLPAPISATISTTVHCDLMDTFSSTISVIMDAIWLFVGFRIFAKA